MTLKLLDRTQETTRSSGTGPFVLAGAVVDFLPFSAGMSDGDTTYILINDTVANVWQVCLATYNAGPNSMTAGTVLATSARGGSVSFRGNPTTQVFCDAPAALFAAILNPTPAVVTPQRALTWNGAALFP